MINSSSWDDAKTNIIAKMSEKSTNPLQSKLISDYIADTYFDIIKDAETILTKQKIIPNPASIESGKQMLSLAFYTFFNSSKGLVCTHEEAMSAIESNYLTLSSSIATAISTFWMSSMMDSIYTGYIPGHVAFVPPCSIVSSVPYVLSFSDIAPFNNTVDFVGRFINACIIHLPLISGLHTGIVPPLPAAPYPLPWVGVN